MTASFRIGEFEIEPATRRLRRRTGETVHLANRPYQVLLHLVLHRDRLVTRNELIDHFWDGRDVYEDALTRCVSTVRKTLGDQGTEARYIETRWAEGYRFVGPCVEVAQGAAAAPSRGGRRARFSSSIDAASAERLVRRGNGYLGRFGLRNQRYALEMFRAALTANPDDYRAWAGIAASHSLQYLHAERFDHHWHGAIDAAREALERKRVSAEAQLARAHVAVMRRDYAEAEAAFSMAEDLDPNLFQAWYHHGRMLAENADHERAVSKFEQAAAANAFDCQALALGEKSLARLGLRLESRRMAQASIEAAELTLRRRPDDVRSLSLGGCLLPGLGRAAEARRWTSRAVTLEPDEPYVNVNAACSYALLGERELAFVHLARVPLTPTGNCACIRRDPSLDALREQPRYAAMMANCGKPHVAAAAI